MKTADDLLKYDSLAFFGRVNASISHELKNIMAIISETAGLLGDLAELASTGKPVGPDVLKNCAGSIMEEIQRGFSTIRQMNRFAHSVDTPFQAVNLLDLLDLVKNLSAYLSYAGKVRIDFGGGDDPVVSTCPFLLQTVLYQALVQAYKCAGPGAEVTVGIRAMENTAWRVGFSGYEKDAAAALADGATGLAAKEIGIGIDYDDRSGGLELEVPGDIENVDG